MNTHPTYIPPKRFAIVTSTGGSVMNALLDNPLFNDCIQLVIADRDCEAIEKSSRHGKDSIIIKEDDNLTFSNRLREICENNNIDYILLFYTRLLAGHILSTYENRIINPHLSLLPSFSGFHSIESALKYGVKIIGTSIHFVDQSADNGKLILQTSIPVSPSATTTDIRHQLFIHQCKSILQVVAWLCEDRVSVNTYNRSIIVERAIYKESSFSPNLDYSPAIEL